MKAEMNLSDVLIDADYLSCRLCNCQVLFDHPWVEQHLQDAHPGLTLKQYFLHHVFRRARVVRNGCHGEGEVAQRHPDEEAQRASRGDLLDQVEVPSDPRVIPCSVVVPRIDHLQVVNGEHQHAGEEEASRNDRNGANAANSKSLNQRSAKANTDEPLEQEVFSSAEVEAATVTDGGDESSNETAAASEGDIQAVARTGKEPPTRRVVVTTEIANLCIFACPKCGLEDKVWKRLRKHLVVEHGFDDSRLFYRRHHLAKKVLHQCVICGIKVICDLTSIGKHALQRHKLSITEYRGVQYNESCDNEERAKR